MRWDALKRFPLALLLSGAWFRAKIEDRQAKRRRFLEKLVRLGVFQKIELPESLPHLWVKPAFHTLDFDTQSELVNVVYAYYVTANPLSNVVVLFDSKTGEEIGKYAEACGGLELK